MPQVDRHKPRQVEIEFNPNENLLNLPYKNRHTLILITQGNLNGKLNDYPIVLNSPCVLCIKDTDILNINNNNDLIAASFSFDPVFLNTVRLSQTKDCNVPNTPRIKEGLSLFNNSEKPSFITLDQDIYPKFLQWFFTMGMEISVQSDDLWVCRVKQYLIQIFNLLKSLNTEQANSPIDLALKYIHTNYAQKVHLNDLIQLTHLNRVSLNKLFKDRVGKTAMQYLISYRLNLAEQMLTHTGMSLNDISLSTGFEYDTYFMKQFKLRNGM